MKLILIAHNIRSSHNSGSLLRTADGLGVESVYFTGYSPYPAQPNDTRLPHIIRKVDAAIQKTALGAEKSMKHAHVAHIDSLLKDLKNKGYTTVAIEQAPSAIQITDFKPTTKTALVVGNEVSGLDNETLMMVDMLVEIPMRGQKESLNVAQAAAIAMYHCLYRP